MSGPTPSPSMKAMIGWSGTWSLPWLMVIFSPAGIFTLAVMVISRRVLFQRIQGGARPEPADLLVRHGVVRLDRDGLVIRFVDHDVDGLSRRERGEPAHAHAVALVEEVVVGGPGEDQGQEALLLQVRLVNAGEAPHEHGLASQVAR